MRLALLTGLFGGLSALIGGCSPAGAQPPGEGSKAAAKDSSAAERLVLAKKLIDAGKPASAKPLLEILVKKYAATKAGKEAKELLGKIEK